MPFHGSFNMFRAQVESFRDFLVWDTCRENQISLGKFLSHISFLAPSLCPSIRRPLIFLEPNGSSIALPDDNCTASRSESRAPKRGRGSTRATAAAAAAVGHLATGWFCRRLRRVLNGTRKDQNELRSAKIRLFLRPEGPPPVLRLGDPCACCSHCPAWLWQTSSGRTLAGRRFSDGPLSASRLVTLTIQNSVLILVRPLRSIAVRRREVSKGRPNTFLSTARSCTTPGSCHQLATTGTSHRLLCSLTRS